jgi:hypothetical protein
VQQRHLLDLHEGVGHAELPRDLHGQLHDRRVVADRVAVARVEAGEQGADRDRRVTQVLPRSEQLGRREWRRTARADRRPSQAARRDGT